jgi:hypothetical protein
MVIPSLGAYGGRLNWVAVLGHLQYSSHPPSIQPFACASSRNCRRSPRNDRATMTTSMENFPEKWALHGDVQRMLANILADPTRDHEAAVGALLGGPLTVAHVNGLYSLIDKMKATAWATDLWSRSTTRRKGHIFHLWLYHLLGGASAKLKQPAAPKAVKAEHIFGDNLYSNHSKHLAIFQREWDAARKAPGTQGEERRAALRLRGSRYAKSWLRWS